MLLAAAGDLTVDAANDAVVTATLTNTVTNDSDLPPNEANNIAITLAFNTIGWDAQNILFNTLDALLGSQRFENGMLKFSAAKNGYVSLVFPGYHGALPIDRDGQAIGMPPAAHPEIQHGPSDSSPTLRQHLSGLSAPAHRYPLAGGLVRVWGHAAPDPAKLPARNNPPLADVHPVSEPCLVRRFRTFTVLRRAHEP